jgi:hypothetical protein
MPHGMTVPRLLPLLLLAACSGPSKSDRDERELFNRLSAVCGAYAHSGAIAQVDTMTPEPVRAWHMRAQAVCDSMVQRTLRP